MTVTVEHVDTAAPEFLVNVTTGIYRYSLGPVPARGMYERERAETGGYYWESRAPLPWVHARVVRRDGSGHRIGTDYLLSPGQEPNSPRSIITRDELKDGSWSGKLGMPLSVDRRIVEAIGTAIGQVAERAPEQEATPRPDVHSVTGYLDIPVAECLPTGYLRMPPQTTSGQAGAVMREVVGIVARNPKMALVMGASAGAPFVGPLRRQSHWYDLYGDSRRGKTTAQAVGAALWGDPRLGTGIVLNWNASAIGLNRTLGQLGILPAFMDERGLISFTHEQWGELIFATSQGASRLTAEVKGRGTRRSEPWFGVLFSTGNARLTDRITAGRFAGIPPRVIELEAPFTTGHAEAKRLTDDLLPRCYGWLGGAILGSVTVNEAREFLARAEALVGVPDDGGVPGTLAEHLHLAVAGAMMIDAQLGTGVVLTDAAVAAARDYLAMHDQEPEHDADRMLDALAETLASRRPAWPTMAEYTELARTRPSTDVELRDPARAPLAQHGYDHELSGVRSDDEEWLYVFPASWQRITDELGLDNSVTCAELYRRNILHVAERSRREGKWTSRPRIGGKKSAGVYQLRLTAIGRDGEEANADTSPPSPQPCPPVEREETDQPSPPASGPCLICAAPGLFCGYSMVAMDDLPCVLCGKPTPVRSLCGAARHGDCRPAEPTPACRVCGETLLLQRPDRDLCERCHLSAAETVPEAPGAPDPAVAQPGPLLVRHGASPAAQARTKARQTELEASLQKLANGEALRLLKALETSHAPRRRVEGRMRAPYWRPELPGIAFSIHLVTGFSWKRPYSGPVVVLDRSGAWVAGASSVEVAHGPLEHTGTADFDGRPGYYQVQAYPWPEDSSMPNPLGPVRGESVWVPAPTVALLRDLEREGRWPDTAILDSYTGDPVRLNQGKWAAYLNDHRASAIKEYGRESDEYANVKKAIGECWSLMLGHYPKSGGTGKQWDCAIHRPDWTHAVQSHARAMLWRRADDCRKLVPDHPPVALRNTDELVIPTQALEVVTELPRPGGQRPPVLIDQDGIQLGSFKVKGGSYGT